MNCWHNSPRKLRCLKEENPSAFLHHRSHWTQIMNGLPEHRVYTELWPPICGLDGSSEASTAFLIWRTEADNVLSIVRHPWDQMRAGLYWCECTIWTTEENRIKRVIEHSYSEERGTTNVENLNVWDIFSTLFYSIMWMYIVVTVNVELIGLSCSQRSF